MNHKTQHPECHPGETFLGNADDEGLAACGWKSKRLGNVAYDVEGDVIPPSSGRLKPLFASTDEIRAAQRVYG